MEIDRAIYRPKRNNRIRGRSRNCWTKVPNQADCEIAWKCRVNRSQAAILLGISENATPSESRKAYLTRARLLHPDRLVNGTKEDLAAANNAMAQLNEAYEVMQKPAAAEPASSQSTDSPPSDNFGFPVWSDPRHACDLCGWGPADRVKFNSVSGFVIFMRWYTFEAKLCKFCARSMYDENQRNTLTKGWWGIFSFFATIYAFFSNMSTIARTRSLGAPTGRYPGAFTISPIPLVASKQWFKRPSAIISSLVALGIAASIGIAAVTPTNRSESSGTTQTTINDLQGICLTEDSTGRLSEVNCDSTATDWIVSDILDSKIFTPEDCVTYDYTFAGPNQNFIMCLEPY